MVEYKLLVAFAFFFLVNVFLSSGFFSSVLQKERSDARRVTLRHVDHSAAGRYACEVSADRPSFTTSMVEGRLNVVGEYLFPLRPLAKKQITKRESKNSRIGATLTGSRRLPRRRHQSLTPPLTGPVLSH